MDIPHLVAKRSTCLRRQVGALLVEDKRILATGYNGAPSGIVHCLDVGCLREKNKIPSGERHELCRGSHAEQNAIVQAAAYGIPIKDAVLFCTNPASEGPRRYKPHFVRAVRPLLGSWRTEKPLQWFRNPRGSPGVG